jgi:hypothetical protein
MMDASISNSDPPRFFNLFGVRQALVICQCKHRTSRPRRVGDLMPSGNISDRISRDAIKLLGERSLGSVPAETISLTADLAQARKRFDGSKCHRVLTT